MTKRNDKKEIESVASATLDLVQDVGDAVIDVLVLFGIGNGKEFIRPCSLFQIGLNGSLEIRCTFHIHSV